MATRRLEEQFEAPTVARIRRLVGQFASIDYPAGTSRYYSLELQTVLEAGALLAALAIGSSLLEITVRELVLARVGAKARRTLDIQAELESKKYIGLPVLLDALCEAELFDSKDAAAARAFYETVRIPVLHGLPRRFVDSHYGELADVMNMFRFDRVVTLRELEEVLETKAIDQLETLATVLTRNLPSAAA